MSSFVKIHFIKMGSFLWYGTFQNMKMKGKHIKKYLLRLNHTAHFSANGGGGV